MKFGSDFIRIRSESIVMPKSSSSVLAFPCTVASPANGLKTKLKKFANLNKNFVCPPKEQWVKGGGGSGLLPGTQVHAPILLSRAMHAMPWPPVLSRDPHISGAEMGGDGRAVASAQ